MNFKISFAVYMHTDLTNRKPRILLHACCGPCSASCASFTNDYEVTVFIIIQSLFGSGRISFTQGYLIKVYMMLLMMSSKERTHVNYIEGEYKVEDLSSSTTTLS